ncbi:MAG: SpoIIE family protein phosphatase [Actinomycetota bacterium]
MKSVPLPDDALSRIARVHAVTAGLAEAGTLDEVAHVLSVEGRLALGAAHGSVWMPTGPGEVSLLAVAGVDEERETSGTRFSAEASLPIATCIREGHPVWFDTAAELRSRFPATGANEVGDAGSLGVVPLRVRGNVIGAIAVRFDGDVVVEEDDRAMLVSIARTGAQALERALLYDAQLEARDRAEQERAKLQQLQDLTSSLAPAMSEHEIIEVLLREAPAALGARAAIVYLFRNDRLALVDAVGFDDELVEVLRTGTEEQVIPSSDALQAGEPVWLGNRDDIVSGYPALVALVDQIHASSMASIPIETGGTTLGAVSLVFGDERSFGAEERGLIVAIARQSALALQRVRLIEAERESENRLRLLVDSNVIGTVVADERVVTDANDAFLEMVGRSREELEAVGIAWPEMTPPEFAAVDAAAIRQLFQTGRAEPFEKEYLRPDGTRVPVLLGLALLDASPFRYIGFVLDLTERKAAEVERQRLLEEERGAREEGERARERLAFLSEASAVLAGSLDYRETLDRVAHQIVPRIADMCTIDLVDESGRLESLAVVHADPEKERFARELRERHPPRRDDAFGAWAAIESNRSQLLEEIPPRLIEAALERTPEVAEAIRGLHIHSVMIVPLESGGRAFGAIGFICATPEKGYSAEDLALAQELARRAAAAIENARLFEEGRQVADILQRSLLPPTFPDIPGIEMAGQFRAAEDSAMVGGDFYDVFTSGGGPWVAALGDVMGKGAPAAAVMGVVRQSIRAAALAQQRPTQMLRTVNESLLQQTDTERYATVVCARLRLRGDRANVTVSCAGHPPPLVLHTDGSVEELVCTGTVLGILPEIDLDEIDLDLSPGDTLVLYSDGVTDEHIEGGEEFGPERLEALLAAHAGMTAAEIAAAIVEAVQRFSEGDPEDDVTVLVLRVRPYGRIFERLLPPEPLSVPEARNALEELRFRIPKAVLDDVRLLVSELVTNSVRHAGLDRGDRIALRLDLEESRVRVEVADQGTGFDLERAREFAAEREGLPGGWGLRLVEQVADTWGVDRGEEEMRVWFEISREREG